LRERLDGADEDAAGDEGDRESQAEYPARELSEPVRLTRDVADAQELRPRVDDEPEPADEREREADDAEVGRAEAACEEEDAEEPERARRDLAGEEGREAPNEEAPAPDLLGRRRRGFSGDVAQLRHRFRY
jgi:hypothetical protein